MQCLFELTEAKLDRPFPIAEAIENLKTSLNAAYDAEAKRKALLVQCGLLGSEQI